MKHLITRKFRCAVSTGVCVALALTSCTPNGNLIVGPFEVTATIGEASFLTTLFTLKGTAPVSHTQKFCDMPSEEELQDEVTSVADFDVSRFIRLHRLDLVKTVLTATSGDFSFMTAMTVTYIPKPGAGDPVVLGAASDPNGFDTEIALIPQTGVDFLELIRANDAADPNDCPKIKYDITFKSVPLHDVEYRLEITVGGYAELGREKSIVTANQAT